LLGQLPERASDLIRARGAGNTQFLVGVLRQGITLAANRYNTDQLC
jgi:hypothetical protein